jgi:dsRNA-specific ribonuclease
MVAGTFVSRGTGKSKREAEQAAARSAYELLKDQAKPQVVDDGK